MPAQRVGTGEFSAAAPLSSRSEFPFADEPLFTAMQSFVPFAVMLAGKGFPTDGADERSLVRVRSEMGP